MYGRLMLTLGVFVDGKCGSIYGIHTDAMGYEMFVGLCSLHEDYFVVSLELIQ